jgi:hypothetical protein
MERCVRFVGEIALLFTALDHQANHIMIEVINLAPPLFYSLSLRHWINPEPW